jgi:hypothetical protein
MARRVGSFIASHASKYAYKAALTAHSGGGSSTIEGKVIVSAGDDVPYVSFHLKAGAASCGGESGVKPSGTAAVKTGNVSRDAPGRKI